MKRLLSILLVAVMILTCLASCKKYDDEDKISPTNEELITERIETFLTAYNTGDMEAVLECLDAKTRNAFQAMLNLLGGLAGSAAGFNINLSDLFSLGVSTTPGDFMGLEITDINVIDSSNATATTIMNLTGAGTHTIYFEMVYENDGWYIHDMTDRKPSGTNDNQEGDSNDGDSANTGNDTNNDTNDTIDSSYEISTCEPFVDGRAWVKYYEQIENQYAQTYYYGFIDLQGNVIYSILAEGVEIYNIGRGSAIITSETELVLINESGEVKMKLNGQAEVKEYGNGFAWIYQNKSTITSLEHLYGVVNHAGEWIEPLQNLQEEGLYDEIEYIGDGFVGTREWRDGVVYPIWNGDKSVQITLDGIFSDCSIEFSNGMAFVSSSIHWADIVCITVITNEGKSNENTQIYETSNDCVIFADGRVEIMPERITHFETENQLITTFSTCSISDKKLIQIDNISIYDIATETETSDRRIYIYDYENQYPSRVEITTYPASMIEEIVVNGDYALLHVRGLDEKMYVTMIDMQGNELITPIEGKYLNDFILAPNGYVYYRQDDVYYIVDKNNNVTKTDIYWYVSFDIGTDVGMICNYFDGISYIKPNGDSLFENLTITE